MRLASGIVLSAAIAVQGTAQQPSAQTVQQQFEAATALDQGPDKAAALAAWEALEKRTARNRRSHAIMLLRKSSALIRLGRFEDATVAARAGLADLPPTDPTLTEDRARAWRNLGIAAQSSLDYAGAAQAFAQAEQVAATPEDKLAALYGEITTMTFTDPDGALAASGRADALMARQRVSPIDAGQFASAKGVLLMNRGDLAGARAATAQAVKALGGLTTRTDLNDVAVRSNAAIALLLSGDAGEARHYMAMTGAGRLDTGRFDPAVAMTPPDCGGEAGLRPTDLAVVEFSIDEDGSVLEAKPIYAAGGGAVALEFARAAKDWSWTPEQVKRMPPFFRLRARVEMRCNMEFTRPSIEDGLDAATIGWLREKGIATPPEPAGSKTAAAASERAALAGADPGSLAALPHLLRLMRNPSVGREETNAFARSGLAIVNRNEAPEIVRLTFDLAERESSSADLGRRAVFRRTVEPLLDRFRDPQAIGAVRLHLADYGYSRGEAQRALLKAVADDPRLVRNDPLRVGALIRIASIDQAAGDIAAARAAFDASGLDATQCALLDRAPKLVRVGGTFPTEAMQWGFEGWTRVQYDVGADGTVENERVVLSYPPFIFTKAGAATMKGARYAKTFRPDGGLGCGATTQNVRFLMPGTPRP